MKELEEAGATTATLSERATSSPFPSEAWEGPTYLGQGQLLSFSASRLLTHQPARLLLESCAVRA